MILQLYEANLLNFIYNYLDLSQIDKKNKHIQFLTNYET